MWELLGLEDELKGCFKPYKGVSSNYVNFIGSSSRYFVSNPIREYLQISFALFVFQVVCCFKPYKGVSSNHKLYQTLFHQNYVSNPIREYLQMSLWIISVPCSSLCFKPYKGVSSNSKELIVLFFTHLFQTL